MAKVVVSDTHVEFKCPGCGHYHNLTISGDRKPCWGFNGDINNPTITPSILMKSGHYVNGHDGGDCWCDFEERFGKPSHFKCVICHSFVESGKIRFLNDCTHDLAGQTVELPEYD